MMLRGDRILRLQARLSDRDRRLLEWLADHQVLTTPQIDRALFGTARFTQHRLLTLHRLGLTDRFPPLRPGGGSYPWHHVLGPTGAEFVAALRDQPPPRPSDTIRRNRRIATSRTLDHLLGVNQFFTDLAAHARTHPHTRLDRWWSEARCAAPGAFAPGLITPVRPDGHGIYAEGHHYVAFYLEYDTGTEPLNVLVAKLTHYKTHIDRGGPAWPVLIIVPNTRREQHLHSRLLDHGLSRISLPVATASQTDLRLSTPAQRLWHHCGVDSHSFRLIDVADLSAPPSTL